VVAESLQVCCERFDDQCVSVPSLASPPIPANPERRRGFSRGRQARSIASLGLLWVSGIAILAVARIQTATPLRDLFLDPAAITGAPWHTGALSNLGIFVWTAGVTFAAAGAWVARRTGREEAAKFLASGTLATLVLVFDDIFAIHSSVLNDITWLPKAGAQLLIVSPTLVWVFGYLNDIRRTRYIILFAGLSCFAGSLLIDQSGFLRGDTALLIEDGCKFLGILAWCQYFALTARDIASSAIGEHGVPVEANPSSHRREYEDVDALQRVG